MASDSVEVTRDKQGVDWRRAEFVLTVLGVLGFVTLPIRLTTVYGGLPAHPLIIHVPVIFIPVTVVTALVFMVRADWFARFGIALAVVSIGTMSSIFLAMNAGGALQNLLQLHGEAAHLINEHSQSANYLAIIYVAFTAVLIITFSAQRISGGMKTGLTALDRALGPRAVFTGLRVLMVLLALGGAVMVFRVGDLGAKAVWYARLHGGGFGGGPPAHG